MKKMTTFLSSQVFWYLILGVFIFQTVWIALTIRFPGAFDEQFHFGIIKLYAQHLSPFWGSQPSGTEQYGAYARDPSYLYQYLLSFPYRLIAQITSSQTAQVIALRLINIAFLTSAVIVFRRVLAQLGASKAMRHIVLAFFVLTPVVPLLGAQINYDNLIVLMTALAFTTYLGFREALRTKLVWDWSVITRLALICLFASLVKYAFLPFAAGLTLAVGFDWRFARRAKLNIVPSQKSGFKWSIVIYTLLLVIGLGLFSERYIVNTVRYHTPIPECDQVLSVERCQAYAPWARNYLFNSYNYHPKLVEEVTYPFTWLHRALGEMVFSITSRFDINGTVDYYAVPQFKITNALSWIIFVVGTVLIIVYRRSIFAERSRLVLLAVGSLYVLALFSQNLLDYLNLGFPVAIHGRYLLPVMPLLYLLVALGFGQLITQFAASRVLAQSRKAALASAVLITFAIEGGGFVTLVASSHDDWFWPQSRPAQVANQYARDVLKPIVIK